MSPAILRTALKISLFFNAPEPIYRLLSSLVILIRASKNGSVLSSRSLGLNLSIRLTSGRLPQNEDEIIIPTHLKTNKIRVSLYYALKIQFKKQNHHYCNSR